MAMKAFFDSDIRIDFFVGETKAEGETERYRLGLCEG